MRNNGQITMCIVGIACLLLTSTILRLFTCRAAVQSARPSSGAWRMRRAAARLLCSLASSGPAAAGSAWSSRMACREHVQECESAVAARLPR